MNDRTGGRRWRRVWPRRAGVLAVTAGAALLVAACSSGSSTSSGGSSQSTNYQQALAYSQCMRSHGVPNYPDPNSGTAPNAEGLAQLGINPHSPQFQAASQTCERLYPLASSSPSQGSGS